MKVIVTRDDGAQHDITESVRIAYDCVRQSLDWGSGFLDTEEVDGIVLLAEACGFPDFEKALQDVWVYRHLGQYGGAAPEMYTPEAGAAMLAKIRERYVGTPDRRANR